MRLALAPIRRAPLTERPALPLPTKRVSEYQHGGRGTLRECRCGVNVGRVARRVFATVHVGHKTLAERRLQTLKHGHNPFRRPVRVRVVCSADQHTPVICQRANDSEATLLALARDDLAVRFAPGVGALEVAQLGLLLERKVVAVPASPALQRVDNRCTEQRERTTSVMMWICIKHDDTRRLTFYR